MAQYSEIRISKRSKDQGGPSGPQAGRADGKHDKKGTEREARSSMKDHVKRAKRFRPSRLK